MNTVIYHDRCHDGFAAATAAHLTLGDTETTYIGASHGDAPPEINGGTVYIVDFGYALPTMQTLVERADKLVWLDHHASMLETSAQLQSWLAETGQTDKAHIVLDMDHSGATLAWKHFQPDQPVPRLFRHIEDRDIWRWQLPETQGFTSALDDLPFDFALWESLLRQMEDDDTAYFHFVETGLIGHKKYLKICADIAERAEPIVIDGIAGLQVNATGEFASQVGNLLSAKSGTYGLIWYVKEGKVRMSFRGTKEFNVIPLANKFGGGGHKAAAGARMPLEKLVELLGRPDEQPGD